ncbi:MAG: hypothetical protein IJH71_07780 [Eubacterium sp.]|nr:hypothetical protein [Eubacterium sp.]
MKKGMLLNILVVLVGVFTFLLASFLLNFFSLREKGNAFAEIDNPSFPVLEITGDLGDYNLMSGYRDQISLSLVRNQVTPVDSSGEISLKLHNYEYDITAIHYILFSRDPDDPLESGTINRLEIDDKENVRLGTCRLKTEIREGRTYYMRFGIRLDGEKTIYYYTRIKNSKGTHLKECMDFARDFHANLFDESKIEASAAYLEPTGKVENSLESIDIHSSLSNIFFGMMKVQEEQEPRVKIREINDAYITLEVNSLLSSEVRQGVIQYYDLCENYKMRYTSTRIYLLDYTRTMDAYYNHEMIDSSENLINLGVQNRDNIGLLSSDEGKRVAFTQQGQLWYYNYQSSDVTRVYSFSSENMSDYRNDPSSHGIKLLNLTDKGEITYLVYGYINRGAHEGRNGIQLMQFDPEKSASRELVFLESVNPYESMKDDVEKFTYLNSRDQFYFILGDSLHRVDLKKKEDEVIRENLVGDSLTASKSQNMIAIEGSSKLSGNKTIELMNLDSGKSHTVKCKGGERIRSVGFLTDDFIYGCANAKDLRRKKDGSLVFPLKKIYIINEAGKTVKTYTGKDGYVMSTSIDGNVLVMELGKKKSGKVTGTGKQDYIRYKEEEKADQVEMVYRHNSVYLNQLYLKFPSYVYIQIEPDLLLAKLNVSDRSKPVTLHENPDKTVRYYVYASGKATGTYMLLPEAVDEADQARGNVIDSNENVVWESVFDSYARVSGMDNVVKTGKKKSLEGCLSMIAAVNGITVKPSAIKTKGKSEAALLEKYSGHRALNLCGCSTDEILYYVSKGCPVLAKYKKGRYVVVMSYNSTNIRYLNPVTGKSISKDRAEVTRELKKAGNVFYSYINEE